MRNQFKAFTQRLSVITEATKAEMHEYTEEAISTISRATESAARRIFQSRNKIILIHVMVPLQLGIGKLTDISNTM